MTLFTLIIFLVSLWVLALYAGRVLLADMQRLLSDQQFSTATFMATDVNDNLSDRLAALQMYAKALSPTLLRQTAQLQAELEKRTLMQSLFNDGIVVLSLDGKAVADIPVTAKRVGVNFMDNDGVIAAIKEGKSSISRPLLSKTSLIPSVSMAVPIHDEQGKVIGAVAGLINLAAPNFLDKISQSHYGETGGFLLLAPKHRLVVTSSDKLRVMENLPALGVDPLVEKRIAGQEGTHVVFNSLDQEVLSSTKSVPVADWLVVVSLPTQEAFAPIRDMQKRLLLATLFLTLLAGVLTWQMLRRQLQPMLIAVKTLAALSQSDQHPQPLPITRKDEIGKLIGGFNHLLLQLGQREALLKQILNTSSVAIFLVDPQGFITQANQRMLEMFGRPVDGLVGQEYVALVNPAECDEARHTMLALLASAIPAVDLDRLYWRADQTEFWGHLSGKRFVDANGNEHGLIGVITDITKRKNAENKLLQHDQVLSAVINNFPGGISMVDADLRVIAYNPELKRLLDFPDELFEKPDLNLADLLRYNAQRGEYGPGDTEQQVAVRIERASLFQPHKFERLRPDGTVLEVCGEPVPGGGFVTIYLDITERKQMETDIRQLAFYDPLTHLPNRRLLRDRLTQALADSKRSGNYGALMFLDLDNFKTLNDTHGHKAGDLLLIEAAHRLRKCVREVDTVARLGGDEFVVMVGDLNEGKALSTAQANTIAEKIRTSMAQSYALTVSLNAKADVVIEHQCTASIGVVVFVSSEGSDEDFLRWADAAMYQAKEAGGNLIRFHESQA